MTLGQSIPVLGDWFIIHFTENYGMAFGLEFSGEYGKLALSIFRIVAVIFIGWYIVRLIRQKAHSGLIACVSLIMAGALGNIIDSSFYGMIFSESKFNAVAVLMPESGGYGSFLHGKVVDMLYFPIIQGFFPEWLPWLGGQHFIFFRPVFNFADTAITLGVFILIIFQKKLFPKPHIQKTNDSLQTQNDSQAMDDPQSQDNLQSVETSQIPEGINSQDIPLIQDNPEGLNDPEGLDNIEGSYYQAPQDNSRALDHSDDLDRSDDPDNPDAPDNSEGPDNSENPGSPKTGD